MNTVTRKLFFISICMAMPTFAAKAQSPAPIIVQAASPVTPAIVAQPPQDSGSLQAAIKSLQESKATNEEMLKKQEAVLQQLDEMQKAADQLKIFTHRTGG